MPETVNITRIPAPRVDFIDPRTGLMAREWYRFFLNLFVLTGEGTNEVSLVDVQVGPPTISEVLGELGIVYDQAQIASMMAQYEESDRQTRQLVETLPRQELGTMSALQQAWLPWVTFNTSPQNVPPTVGTMAWDGGTTLGIQATTDVLMRVGEAEYVYVKASGAITKGQLCYHTGAVGGSGVITAAPTPLALTDPNQIVGVAAESIALNGFGLIQVSGSLRGFDTTGTSVGETWADGDPLYYNPAYVGGLTKTKPAAPNQKTYIGEVINASSGGSGSINIRITPGSVLGGTDSNVQITSVANNDLLQYDSVLQYWKNVAASSLSIGTATNIAGGAAGSLPYQSGASTTTFLAIGTNNYVLTSNGTAPTWTANTGTGNVVRAASPTLTGTVSGASLQLSSLTSGRVTYAGASGLLQDSANLLYSGTDLTVYGITVGRGAGAVASNTAVGASALAANTTGSLNTAVGASALTTNSTAANNTAVGYQAALNTNANSNTAIGHQSLLTNTTGAVNVAVGSQALYSNLGGGNNTALGALALYTNTSGGNLVAIGRQALYSNSTGGSSVAVGYQSQYYQTGGSNDSLGLNALRGASGTSTGTLSVAIGRESLYSSTSGYNNTALGYQAGYAITTGGVNTFLGYTAGNAITSGNYNVVIGAYTGNSGGLDIRTASNNIVLSDGQANIRQYYLGASDAWVWLTGGSERLRIDSSGNVVITGVGGLGYATGSGGAVTQATSRTTGVTLDKTNGAITLVSAAGTATWQSFTVTNNKVAATDTVIVNQKSGTDLYMIHVTNVAAGSFRITFATTGGTTTEQPVFNFAIIKAVTS